MKLFKRGVHRRFEIVERILFWYAVRIDDKDVNLCWARLALWAMGFEPFLSLWRERADYIASTDCDWCGKCGKTGRYKEGPK